MEIAFGLANDGVAERTFRADFPEAVFRRADIAGIDASDFDGLVEASAFHPVLFNACAPCQPFSRQRNGVAPPTMDAVAY